MNDTKITNIRNEQVTLYGSGVWFEAREQEWLVIYSQFAADLFKVERKVNRLVLDKYASIDIYNDTTEDEIIAALFIKVFPPRNNEQEEQLSE